MGLFTRFRSAPPPAAAAAQEVWRRGDFTTVPMGMAEHAVHPRGAESLLLPSFVVEFLYGCDEFRPLEQQVRLFAEQQGWESLQVDALRHHLPQLIEGQLLVSPGSLRSRVLDRSPAESEPPLPGALGIVTGGSRWPLLQRCLDSFQEDLQRHGRTAEFLVSDNSAAVADRERCREALAHWQRRTGAQVRFAGEPEKRSFADALVHAGACPPEIADFALFDPLGAGFSCGANRNALLLHEAGRLFCSLDDDILCELLSAPEDDGTPLAVTSDVDPYSRWLFASRAAVKKTGACARGADFLQQHQQLLGRSFADLLRSNGSADFGKAGDVVVRRLLRQPCRVRATFLGQAGDPGIPSSAYYLYYRKENRRRLTASADAYHSFFSSRHVLALSPTARVGDPTVSPGMAMGLDHRTLLPPFFPVLHAEDYSFGAALWQCCPEGLLGHLPFAIAHEPPEGKAILAPSQLTRQRPFVAFEFAHQLRRLLLRLDLPEAASAEQRMTQLGRFFSELGALPASDFHEMLRLEALGEASARLNYLHRSLVEEEDAPDFWRQDLEAFADYTRSALTQPGAEIPLDLPSTATAEDNRTFLRQALSHYGALLQHWPAMVAAARALRESGQPLMPPFR